MLMIRHQDEPPDTYVGICFSKIVSTNADFTTIYIQGFVFHNL